MLSPLSLTVCGGTGAITPTAGAATPIMAGADTHLTMPVAGALAGAASMEAGAGDITIIITIPEAGILVEDIGAVAAGGVIIGQVGMCIPTDVQAVLTIIALAVQMVTAFQELQQLLLAEVAVVP